MKTSDLTGAALDWAVAKCEGCRVEFDHQYTEETKFDGWWQLGPNHWQPLNKYSTDWAQGGPIIEREKIGVWLATYYVDKDGVEYGNHWYAEMGCTAENVDLRYCDVTDGPTPLIAAMRCYVASKLGDDVTLPHELEQTA